MFRGNPRRASVALTYDDGPHPIYTLSLLALLASERIKATFFINGNPATQHPELVQRMAQEGHEIGNHLFAHDHIDRMNYQEFHGQVSGMGNLITALTGRVTRLIRPPYGKITPYALLYALLHSMSLVLWSTDSTDSLGNDMESICARIRSHPFRAGDIILMHEDYKGVCEVTRTVVARVRDRGLGFATVGELLGYRPR